MICAGVWPLKEEETLMRHREERLDVIADMRDHATGKHKEDIERLWKLVRDYGNGA